MGKVHGAKRYLSLAALLTVLVPALARGQGVFLTDAGRMHLSMVGPSTTTAVDDLGALYWNPATIGCLPRSEDSEHNPITFGGSGKKAAPPAEYVAAPPGGGPEAGRPEVPPTNL